MKWRQDTRQIRNDSNRKHYLMMVQCIRQGMHGKFSYFFVSYLLFRKKTQIILLWHKAYFAASSKWPNCIFSRKITFSYTFLNVANGTIHWVKRTNATVLFLQWLCMFKQSCGVYKRFKNVISYIWPKLFWNVYIVIGGIPKRLVFDN